MESCLVRDGALASDSAKVASMWALRERIAEALLVDGYDDDDKDDDAKIDNDDTMMTKVMLMN